ncbi:MAG: retroviral-like aspartic protease family protein [Terriglobia bacterium]
MSQFTVRVRVANPADPARQAEVELLVDTGATSTWVSAELLEKIGAPPLPRRSCLLADGRRGERATAAAVVTRNGVEVSITLVAAQPGDAQLLGATALESLGFAVDPEGRRLLPRELLAM